MSTASLQGFIVAPGFEEALIAELGLPPRVRAGEPRWPSLITARAGRVPDPVFALQRLPDAHLIRAESVSGLVEAAFPIVAPTLDQDEGPVWLHTFVPDRERYRTVEARGRLLDDSLRALLKDRRRRAYRRLCAPEAAGWGEGTVLQLAVAGRSSVLVSAARPRALPTGGYDVSPWPAGVAPVAEDKTAPSRAYGKLEESFAWLGSSPTTGELVVDLGGSPGGWAWKALVRGARVVAVDRSPLAAPALGHPSLSMVLGNAFTYEPPTPAQWLLCDVICEPPRTFDLVERWMSRGWAQNVVATLKFKGRAGYDLIEPGRARLAKLGWSFLRIKHMSRNHNEAMILARR